MGFDYNPYKHLELIQRESEHTDSGGRTYKAGITWYCHNCGGEGQEAWKITSSLKPIVDHWFRHLISSHNAMPIHFEGWSVT